jgi:peptidoglycan/xylan/chitin deacetylase (PgdA/CDA1 family)
MKKLPVILLAIALVADACFLSLYNRNPKPAEQGAVAADSEPGLGTAGEGGQDAPPTASIPTSGQSDASLGAGQSEAPSSAGQADEKLEAELAEKRGLILDEAGLLFRGYFYEEALALLGEDESLINDETIALEMLISKEKDDLVLFEGDFKHIFFHSLILYPEHLFPNVNTPTGGYNEGFSYQRELERMLPQLLDRGYVLYDINMIFSKDENGEMQQRDVYLPPGKRPLVLSIDDPSYHYGVGFAHRVILDENGDIATEVITPSGETIITYDGDVELMVDSFVREHPEFSFRGAKGIIASTGYMGIFGYDLKTEESRQAAIAVSEKMKSNGWLFASHSYTHNRTNYWGPGSNADSIRYDTRRWREEIEPIIGRTNIFIAPFGYTLRGEAMQVIIDNGYDIYCNVDLAQRVSVYPDYALMGRVEIGGYALSRWGDTLTRDFFDVATVKDAYRPPVISS